MPTHLILEPSSAAWRSASKSYGSMGESGVLTTGGSLCCTISANASAWISLASWIVSLMLAASAMLAYQDLALPAEDTAEQTWSKA